MHNIILHAITTKKGDWRIRIDPRHGNKDYHRKHVHITKRGLSGEYSWNEDGSRHDQHKFPNCEQCISKAKNLAAEALSVPKSSLSLLTALGGGFWYRFSY